MSQQGTHRGSQQDLAARFRQLHAANSDTALVLPNAWDAMSARLVEAAGAQAIATTSAGISWALGYPDGEGLTRDQMIESIRRIVAAVSIPVTADVERGYGAGTPEDVAATVRAVVGAGAVGVNLEDSPGAGGAPLMEIPVQVARLSAARAAAKESGVEVFINARIDTYVRKVGDDAFRFEETVRRARAYVAAGADGVFVPLVTDPGIIGRLVTDVGAPLNLIGGPGVPSIPELRRLGVARVSVGPGLARAVMAFIRRSADEVLTTGTYETLAEQLTSPEANALFAKPAS